MASGSSSTDFFQLFINSPKELYSEKFYDAMDMVTDDLKDYDETCSKIKVKGEYDQMIQLCKKYLRFLAKSKSWASTNSGDIVSLLLNYWLYDKLTRIYPDSRNFEINFGFAALQRIWSTFSSRGIERSYYKKCKPDWEMVNHTDWEERKKLNDYYIDFNTLFSTGSIYDSKCEEFYKKIKEMIPVCAHFKEKCIPGEYKCPGLFFMCDKKDLNFELKQLSCHATIEARSASVPGPSIEHPPPLPHLESPAEDYETSGPKSTEEIHGSVSTSQSSDIKTKVTQSVLSAAPVLLTGTMLYRYTPLGPWIRRFGGGRTNSMDAMNTFSPYTEETGNMFPEDTANFISYQPI